MIRLVEICYSRHARSGPAHSLSIVIPQEAVHVVVSSQRFSPTQKTNQPMFVDRNFFQLIESCVYPTPVYLPLLPEVSHPISFSFLQAILYAPASQLLFLKVLFPTHTFLYFLLHHLEAELSQEKHNFPSVPHLVGFTVGLWPG